MGTERPVMKEYLPSRRAFLSAGAAAAVSATAGCLGLWDGTPGDDGGSGATLELTARREEDSLVEKHVQDLGEREPEWSEDAFEAAVAGEAYTTQYRKPFYSTPEDPKYAERDGTYYRLGSVVVDEAAATNPVLRLTGGDHVDEETPDGVAAEDLPAPDERAVKIAHMAARARGNEGGAPWELIEHGGYVYRSDAAVEESRLLGADGPESVVVMGRRYDVETTREQFHEPVYRATVEPVADDPEMLERALRGKFLDARFDGEDISEDARQVLLHSRDGVEETHPYSAEMREVLRAIHERAYIDGDAEKDALPDDAGHGLVQYDGDYYEYYISLQPTG
jgi:hypothetical protein